MHEQPVDAASSLDRPLLFITVARAAEGGHACRDYVVLDQNGVPLLEARAFPWRRAIVVRSTTPPGRAFLTIRRRLGFPLTGRVDVFDAHGARLGVLNRNGEFRDAHGRSVGRFRDARTFRDHAGETIAMGVLDALFAGDGTTAIGSGPDGFVWLAGAEPIGTLARSRLPFRDDDDRDRDDAARAASVLQRVVRRFRGFARSQPRGWKLQRTADAAPGHPRLVVAAALFAVELSHW